MRCSDTNACSCLSPPRLLFCWLPLLIALVGSLGASPTDWVAPLWNAPQPDYGPEVPAVCLLDEEIMRVTDDGETRSSHRLAYRILTREGLNLAWIRLEFDGETRIRGLRAWNLKPDGVVHEAVQKDAVETQLAGTTGVLFEDTKSLVLLVPQVDVGSVVAFEWERRHRPYIHQNQWQFQKLHPVLRARFELELPEDWDFEYRFFRHPPVEPREAGKSHWFWELRDLPGIHEEPGMPPLSDLGARIAVNYFPSSASAASAIMRKWDDVARWMSALMSSRIPPSREISDQASALGDPKAMAEFVQREIRYVAIAIGIGGFQPHFAREVFQNRYGDCKDQVTLLHSFMHARGKRVYPVLINTERKSIDLEFPSPFYFNHMIAAIPVSAEGPPKPAGLEHPQLGRLLLFDPTDRDTPYGRLRSVLGGTTALLIDGDRGHLIETPVRAPVHNRRLRTGTFELLGAEGMRGNLVEIYSGDRAVAERSWLRGRTHRDWMRGAQRLVARWSPGSVVKKFSVSQLESDGFLREDYELELPHGIQTAGPLLLFRPAVIGEEPANLPHDQDRVHDYLFEFLKLSSTRFTFMIPEGYTVEQLPPPVEVDLPFARFRMEIQVEAGKIRYASDITIKALSVPAGEVSQLRDFYSTVARASDTVILLTRSQDASFREP